MLIVEDACPVSRNASFESADRGEISQLWQELLLCYLAIFDKTLDLFPRGTLRINFRIALCHHIHGVKFRSAAKDKYVSANCCEYLNW